MAPSGAVPFPIGKKLRKDKRQRKKLHRRPRRPLRLRRPRLLLLRRLLNLLLRTYGGKAMPYLHKWRWPQKGEVVPGGQPTDTAPLDEGDTSTMRPIMSLLQGLVTSAWHWGKRTIVTDKGFTSFQGCHWLAGKGVAFVGMYKTRSRPKEFPNGPLADTSHG